MCLMVTQILPAWLALVVFNSACSTCHPAVCTFQGNLLYSFCFGCFRMDLECPIALLHHSGQTLLNDLVLAAPCILQDLLIQTASPHLANLSKLQHIQLCDRPQTNLLRGALRWHKGSEYCRWEHYLVHLQSSASWPASIQFHRQWWCLFGDQPALLE